MSCLYEYAHLIIQVDTIKQGNGKWLFFVFAEASGGLDIVAGEFPY